MKKIFDKIKSFANNIRCRIKAITKEPAEFLGQGKAGGMVMCALLTAQFLYGCIFSSVSCLIPAPVIVLLLFGTVILMAELMTLIFKLILGGGKRSRLYFLLAWSGLATAFFIGTQLHNVLSGLIISFLVALSVDVFGRCIFGFIKTRKWKQKFGYITLLISTALIVLFAMFFHLDSFGESRIEKYLAIVSENNCEEIPEFSQYLVNGEHEVSVIDYGQDDTFDIVTECADISKIVEREGILGKVHDLYFDNSLDNVPITGRIWYPEGLTDCPVMFIAHGNHDFSVPSYLGYDYLGEYLASNGYVVVSVDENLLNGLGDENDARAILLLENIKAILEENAEEGSSIYELIDSDKIAIAGHSRGGEMVTTAYLFNDLEVYPDDGNIKFDYHFNISSIIAIAPTVDQYMPAEHAVEIKDVNYLLIHGSNDQDVSIMMGEKQYNNIYFSENSEETYLKSSVYIMGANHGQFNTTWGQYDGVPGTNGFLNTNNFLEDTEQQLIAKAYIRTFLDRTLLNQNEFETLLSDNGEYRNYLPRTVYITNYMDSNFERYCSFEEDTDIMHGVTEDVVIRCYGMNEWKERMDVYGSGTDGENYVLECTWAEAVNPSIEILFPITDLSAGCLTFRIADMREDTADDISVLVYIVELYDVHGNMVSVTNPKTVYPALTVQLYKQDVFFDSYEYKHQMQTVQIDAEMFTNEAFDYSAVNKMVIIMDEGENGQIILDDVGWNASK